MASWIDWTIRYISQSAAWTGTASSSTGLTLTTHLRHWETYLEDKLACRSNYKRRSKVGKSCLCSCGCYSDNKCGVHDILLIRLSDNILWSYDRQLYFSSGYTECLLTQQTEHDESHGLQSFAVVFIKLQQGSLWHIDCWRVRVGWRQYKMHKLYNLLNFHYNEGNLHFKANNTEEPISLYCSGGQV